MKQKNKLKTLLARILALSLVATYSVPIFAEEVIVEEAQNTDVVEEVVSEDGVAQINEVEDVTTENIIEEVILEETVLEEVVSEEMVAEETVLEETVLEEMVSEETVLEETLIATETTIEETTSDTTSTESNIIDNAQENKDIKLSMTCYGTAVGYTDNAPINLANVGIYVNGDYIGSMLDQNYFQHSLESWVAGDIATVTIDGLSNYIGSVTVQGNTYPVINGVVSFEVEAQVHEGEEYVEVEKEGEMVYESQKVRDIEVISIKFNLPESCLYLRAYASDGGIVPGATVTGYFRVYDTNGGYVDLNKYTYIADNRGWVCIQGECYREQQAFVYTCTNGVNEAIVTNTGVFTLASGNCAVRDAHMKHVQNVIPDIELIDKEIQIQKDAENQSIAEITSITSYRNVMDSFINPSNLSVKLTNVETGEIYTFSIEQFGTTSLGKVKKGVYNVEYIGDAYFTIEGVQQININNDTYDLPIAVTAKYTLEIHKVKNGQEVEWSITHPLTGEMITATGVRAFAVAPNSHYYLIDDTGNTFDVALGLDSSNVTMDMESGAYQYTNGTGAADKINEIPQTGDKLVAVLVAMGVLAVGGAIAYIYNKKQEKTKDQKTQDQGNTEDIVTQEEDFVEDTIFEENINITKEDREN